MTIVITGSVNEDGVTRIDGGEHVTSTCDLTLCFHDNNFTGGDGDERTGSDDEGTGPAHDE